MKCSWLALGVWFSVPVLTVMGCAQGSVDSREEPRDAEEATSEPDGGDGDWFGDDALQGDDAQPEDEGAASDEGAGDEGVGDAPMDGTAQDGDGPGAGMLLFDGDGRQFTYDDSGFHVLINPGDQLPADNWLDPVDYYNGEFHVRYVVNSPADQQAGQLQTCIWTMGDDGIGGDYYPESCGQQVAHSGPGEYFVTARLKPADWWKLDDVPLDYSHPERFLVRVVLRGTSGCNVTRYNVGGACWDEWPKYENMNFRVTIVMVGAGESFSGWGSYP